MKRLDPGLALLALALALAAALYAPTLGRGLVNYDDSWIVRDNTIAHELSVSSLRAVFFDTSAQTRATLGAEYLPVRDVSVMVDFAIWGDWWPGHHVTNLVLYLAAIALWFGALVAFGVPRTLAGLALLIWAVHPTHAESVAWLAERKGLLGVAFAGASALAFARFRLGGRPRWLALAVVTATAAIWSTKIGAFAVASLAIFELAAPAPRASVRRSAVGLATIAAAGAAAFVPVVLVAVHMSMVASAAASAGRMKMAIGLFGVYTELGAMAIANAVSYPIRNLGPSATDVIVGVLGLVVTLAIALAPRIGGWRPPPLARAAAAIWLLGWLPASRLVMPLREVIVADRYVLFSTLGVALAVAMIVCAISSPCARTALAAAIVLAASMRTLDAERTWRSGLSLWERAVESNPDDGDAWAGLVSELDAVGRPDLATEIMQVALQRAPTHRLVFWDALIAVEGHERARGIRRMYDAARMGDQFAMANLGVLLAEDGARGEAFVWAWLAVETGPPRPAINKIYRELAPPADRH